MYMRHGSETIPPDDTAIWRYVDFMKFVSMLETRSLFFSRPDAFEDRFECTWGKASLANIEADLKSRQARGVNVVGRVSHQLRAVQLNASGMRKATALNCWHANDYESDAMWKTEVDPKNWAR